MKTLSPAVLLLLTVVPGCSRDDAPQVAKQPAVSSASGLGLVTVAAKPEIVPADKRRVIELEGGVRVEVIAEGEGDVVGTGDEVALSLTLSYMPKSAEQMAADAQQAEDTARVEADEPKESKSKGAKDANESEKDVEPTPTEGGESKTVDESAKKLPPLLTDEVATSTGGDEPGTAAKSDSTDAPAADAVPQGTADADAAATALDAGAKSGTAAVAETDAASDAVAAPTSNAATEADAEPATGAPAADSTQSELGASASTAGTAPAPPALDAPLEPVIVVSTRNLGTPIRARVGKSGALVPGLSRALVGLRQGTIAEITLPAEAAYGAAGLPSAGIPPGTALLARVEIREVRR